MRHRPPCAYSPKPPPMPSSWRIPGGWNRDICYVSCLAASIRSPRRIDTTSKAPSVFSVRNVGKTLVSRTQGTKIISKYKEMPTYSFIFGTRSSRWSPKARQARSVAVWVGVWRRMDVKGGCSKRCCRLLLHKAGLLGFSLKWLLAECQKKQGFHDWDKLILRSSLDAIVYCYHNMIVEVINWDIKKEKLSFGFGYVFRQSNRLLDTLDRFSEKLESVYTTSGGKKIYLITHSMWGLLIKCSVSLHSDVFEKYVKSCNCCTIASYFVLEYDFF